MDSKTALLKRFHQLLNQQNLMIRKYDIIAGFGVTSSKQLSVAQLNEICRTLEKQATPVVQAPKEKTKASDEMRKARSIVLNLLNSLGYTAENGDWTKVNAYLKEEKILGKTLYEATIEELLALSRKLRAIIYKRQIAEKTDLRWK